MKLKWIFIFCSLICLFNNTFAICDGHRKTFKSIDPIDGSAWEINSNAYLPLGFPGPRFPVVFILPPIIGANDLDRTLATRLCLNGIGSYILNTDKDVPELVSTSTPAESLVNMNSHHASLLRAAKGVAAAIDELQENTSVSGNFGILGASLGGIQSAYVAGVESRIKSSVILAGAGNIPGILTYSEQEGVARQRKSRFHYWGFQTNEEYMNIISHFVPEDPLKVASHVRPGSMFMFIIKNDTSVPTKYQIELKDEIREPRIREINLTHVPGIIEAGTVYGGEIIEFFADNL